MMSGAPFEATNLYGEHEQTPVMAEVRTLIGTLNPTKNKIVSTLQTVHPSMQDDALRALAPAHTAAIDAVFADGIGTVSELSSLVKTIAKNATVTQKQVDALLSDPDYLDPSDWDSELTDSLPVKNRKSILQKRFNVIHAALVQSAKVMDYMEGKLNELLEAAKDHKQESIDDFTEQPDGPVANEAILTLPKLGRMQVFHGGSMAPVIVGDALRVGNVNGPYATTFPDGPIFIKSILVRHISGGGVNKINVPNQEGNHYYEFTSTQTIAINHWADGISLISSEGNVDEVADITFEVTIPGTGITQEILDLEEAQEKMERLSERGAQELHGLLKTGYPKGSVIPPGETIEAYESRHRQLFDAVEETVASLGAPSNETIMELIEYGSSLNDISKVVTPMVGELEERSQFAINAEKTMFTSLLAQGKESLSTIRHAITAWQEAVRELWEEGASRISPALHSQLTALAEGRDIHLLKESADMNALAITNVAERIVKADVALSVAEGSMKLTAFRGRDDEAPMWASASDNALVLSGTSGMIDLSGARGTVVKMSFTPRTTSASENNVVVTFVRGNQELASYEVLSGDTVSHEDISGITGVLVRNAADLMHWKGRELYEYRQTYQKHFEFNDPGPDHYFFLEVHPEWTPERPEIAAEADKGDVHQPTTIENTEFILDMDRPLVAEELTRENSILYSMAEAQRINSRWLPNNYPAKGLDFRPFEYNIYWIKKFGGGPADINYIGYETSNTGAFVPLPPDMYTVRGNQFIVFPTGHHMNIAASINGKIMSSNTPVGYVVHGDLIQSHASSIEEALRPDGPLIEVEEIKMMTMNAGGPLGWQTGAWLEYDGDSPVAMGWLKARARITNSGNEAANITVTTYSGFAGTSGWNSPQGTYQTTLGAGESRLLTDDIFMYANENGGSIARFIIKDTNTGRVLAEGLRSVNAPSMPDAEKAARLEAFKTRWTAAIAEAQEMTRQYFASLGITGPSMADPQTIVAAWQGTEPPSAPTIADIEDKMRQDHRILAHALESGDPQRIAWAQVAYNDSYNQYIAMSGQMLATPSTVVTDDATEVHDEELGFGGTPGAAMLAGLTSDVYGLFQNSMSIMGYETGSPEIANALTLQAHYEELHAYGQQVFSANDGSSSSLAAALAWVMKNGVAMTELTGNVNVIQAAKIMLLSFATGVIGIPESDDAQLDIPSLEDISVAGASLTDLKNALKSVELISVNDTTLAGRTYLWLIDRIDSAQTFEETYEIAKSLERSTDIPWWKITSVVWRYDGSTFIRNHAWDIHAGIMYVFQKENFVKTFKNTTGTPLFDASTDRYIGSAPSSPEWEWYQTYESSRGPADQYIRIHFDVKPVNHQTFDHVDVYLCDKNGIPIKGTDNKDILLTTESVRGQLFVKLPVKDVTKYIDAIPYKQQGTNSNGETITVAQLKLRVVVWFSDIPGTPGNPLVTAKVVEVRDLTNAKANLSHLPAEDLDILNALRSPLKSADWSINMASGAHNGTGVYALDFNASNDDSIAVYSPGRARLVDVDLIDGTIKLELSTSTGKIFSASLLHMDHILEKVTGETYVGLAEFLAANFPTEWSAASGTSRDRIDYLKSTNATIAAALVNVENRMAQVQAIIDSMIAQGYWIDDAAEIGQIGNEGLSQGHHLDFRVHFNGKPINLFGWADAYHPGIQVMNVEFENGKELDGMRYDRALSVLVHDNDRIVMSRNASGQNMAYAWEEGVGLGAMKRAIWTDKLPNGSVVDAWLNETMTQKWNHLTSRWEDL